MSHALSYNQALTEIGRSVLPKSVEKRKVEMSLGRVAASAHRARQPYPSFSQSQYDGYAIAKQQMRRESNSLVYRIDGEIPAGQEMFVRCRPGGAFRIMTGAPVPQGSWKVIPQEYCNVSATEVSISQSLVLGAGQNIKHKGEDIAKDSILVKKGTCLSPTLLARLTDGGVGEVEVYKKPVVGIFCSGSELIEAQAMPGFGKKISSNRILLAGLIESFGGKAEYFGTVVDEQRAIGKKLREIAARKPDIVISTGGMGPGKYDFLKECFAAEKGKVVFSSLKLRPGKSTLFGLLDDSVYFGLPGPPPAVFALFHSLIRPALLKMQGVVHWKMQKVMALLEEDVVFERSGVVRLIAGVVQQKLQEVWVRAVAPGEYSNCFILLSAKRKQLRKGACVPLISTTSLPYPGNRLLP